MPVRKISRCQQDFIELIYKLAGICNLKLTDYVVEFGCEDIDSFFTGLFKVQLRDIRDGHKIRKGLLIKWHPDVKMRACFREAYRREFIFYRHIVPKLLEIQKSIKNNEGLKIKFPNCVLASVEHDRETVAVVDLQEQGFIFRDRLIKADLDYVSLVMKNLAKFHALSFVLKKTRPEEFAEITKMIDKDVQYSNPGPAPKNMRSYYEASVNVVINENFKDKLKKLGPAILTVLHKCTLPDEYSTICHGDCWNNNIFYKHQGNKPVDVMFIDYQLTRYASPATDISYFLYMSTDGDYLANYYDHVLNVYYGTLAAVLRYCNLDANEVYPRNIFEQHLRECSIFGLIEALVAMMIITAPPEEAYRMAEKYGNEECEEDCPNKEIFVKKVNGVVDDFFGRQYSLDAILNK